MEEAPANGEESSHSAHANGIEIGSPQKLDPKTEVKEKCISKHTKTILKLL
jgi:hypothetical protein